MRIAIYKEDPSVKYYHIRDIDENRGVWLESGKEVSRDKISWVRFVRQYGNQYRYIHDFKPYYEAAKRS